MYLLAIRGTLRAPALEDSRALHNQTAGNPEAVAAAKALGDLSHMVYVPVARSTSGPNEFLILDVWNSLEGLNKFFSNHQVQEQAGRIFTTREPLVWTPAEGLTTYHLPVPYGKNERVVALARGTVESHDGAKAPHNKIVGGGLNTARKAGSISHEAYFRLNPQSENESKEILAVDLWMDAQGMNQFLADPEVRLGFQGLFTSPPSISAWIHPPGDWVEW